MYSVFAYGAENSQILSEDSRVEKFSSTCFGSMKGVDLLSPWHAARVLTCLCQNRTEQNIRLGLTASLLAGRVAGFPQILPGPGQPSENRDLTAPCF